MRELYRFFLVATVVLLPIGLTAQNLINSRNSSYNTFIYKVTDDQAKRLYRDIWNLKESDLTNLIDFYPSDSIYRKSLPFGHYVFVKSVKDHFECSLESINNLEMSILNNHRDLILVFNDSLGNEQSNLTVRVNNKKIPYEKSIKAYRLRKTNKKGIVSVVYRNQTSYFEIDRKLNRPRIARVGSKIFRTFPINHIISPYYYVKSSIKRIIYGDRLIPPGIFYRVKRIFKPYQTYKGYLVFNKPKYKPSDTVRLKAYITANGRPLKKSADVFLSKHYSEGGNKKLGTIKPFRPGAYQYEFKIADSLNLRLDSHYSIELHNKKRTLISSGFQYEDYELKSNVFSVRADNSLKHKPAVLYLKGADTNDMPLYDIRVEILLRPKEVNKKYADHIFVPDTLWFHKTKLESLGETKISIPDSVFLPLSFNYEAEVAFLNSDNERTVKSVSLSYDKKVFPLSIDIKADTLYVNTMPSMNFSGVAQLCSSFNDEHKREKFISIPYKEKLNYYSKSYSVGNQEDNKFIDVSKISDQLQILANRTGDSLFITTENPRKIPFRYFLFKNQRLLNAASGEFVSVKQKSNRSHNYSVSVQYIWAGEAQTKEFEIPFDNNLLDIKFTHNPIIYPGQKATFRIDVRDSKGEPVSDVDLTAYAITKKFEKTPVVSLPRFTKSKSGRSIFNEFNKKDSDLDLSKRINYSYWKKTLGLDSMEFYKFLFPQSGGYEFRFKADTSQFAPFVISWNGISPVQIIYVDDKPVYYSGVNTIEPYSFAVSPGKHKIDLRLFGWLITTDSILIEDKQKLIFSIDLLHLPAKVLKKEMPYSLTAAEQLKLSRYFLLLHASYNSPAGYLQQGHAYHAFTGGGNSTTYGYNGMQRLAGPFTPGSISYADRNGVNLSFEYEPFFSYEFKDHLIRQREAKVSDYIKSNFNKYGYGQSTFAFKDQVQTKKRILDYWKELDEAKPFDFKRFPDFEPTTLRKGLLTLEGLPQDAKGLKVVATFVVSLDNPDDYCIISNEVKRAPFAQGNYQAIVLLDNDQYVRVDSIHIKPFGQNFYNLTKRKIHQSDSLSKGIKKTIVKWMAGNVYVTKQRQMDLQSVRQLYYQESGSAYSFNHTVSGRVYSAEDGSPLPGVNVVVKGTAVGTVTDAEGYYSIHCLADATLVFSFIGLQTSEINIRGKDNVNINLNADVTQLSEVVVSAYVMQTQRKSLSSSVSTSLAGKVSGMRVRSPRFRKAMSYSDFDSVSIMIRGSSSISADSKPLIILDGRIVSIEEVDQSSVTAVEILKGTEATAIYGAAAANGVILFSTVPGATKESLKQSSKMKALTFALETTPGSSIRKNFRDYAFWKPNLKTDDDGKAEFEATFPDDITGWSASVIGMASKRRSGQANSVIQSYKPLLAQIAQPNFLIQGDTASIIGKITNYAQKEITLSRIIKINDSQTSSDLTIKDSKVDSLRVIALNDSMKIEYLVNYNNYSDGESRKIPVYPKGVKEVNGTFLALNADTTLNFSPDQNKGISMKIYAQADLIDVLIEEIEYLKNYSYDCNEQLASRLWGLMLEKKIKQYRNEAFKGQKEIEKIIKKLVSHQNKDGSWSWWGTGEGSDWITLHVARSLTQAQKDNFVAPFSPETTINFIESRLQSMSTSSKLAALVFLAEQGENLKAKELTDSVMKSKRSSFHEKILAQKLLQTMGQKTDWQWINNSKSQTVKGNLYWGENKNDVSDNSVMNTLIVYGLIEKEFPESQDLTKIRNYFLERRKSTWRNTYESSQILKAILPGLLRNNSKYEKPILRFSNGLNLTVDKFPFAYEGKATSFTVQKSGTMPVYFTTYQEHWNSDPKPVENEFKMTTVFEGNPPKLNTGKPYVLNVEVEIKKDAEYVMIEVPIPGGCSYESKPQYRRNGEVHREYFHNKVSIFCQYLKKGNYTYSIPLLPRYSGKYTINPAIVECMYFPVVYGRNESKKLLIK